MSVESSNGFHKRGGRRERNKKRKRRRKHGTLHHMKPSSRCWGGEKNFSIMEINERKHLAWHSLYHNYLKDEAIAVTKCWVRKNGTLNVKKLGPKMYQAYKLVFGGAVPPAQAMKMIRDDSWIDA